jgi:hypothetical protein
VKAERATAKVALLAFLFLFSTDIPVLFQSISNNWYFGTSPVDIEFYIRVYHFYDILLRINYLPITLVLHDLQFFEHGRNLSGLTRHAAERFYS